HADRHRPLRGGPWRHPTHPPDQHPGPTGPPPTPARAAPTRPLATRRSLAGPVEGRVHHLTEETTDRMQHTTPPPPPTRRTATETAGARASRTTTHSSEQDRFSRTQDRPHRRSTDRGLEPVPELISCGVSWPGSGGLLVDPAVSKRRCTRSPVAIM